MRWKLAAPRFFEEKVLRAKENVGGGAERTPRKIMLCKIFIFRPLIFYSEIYGGCPKCPPPRATIWAVKRLWDHPCYLQRCRVNSAEASGVILGVPAYPVKKLSLLNFSSRSTRIKIPPYRHRDVRINSVLTLYRHRDVRINSGCIRRCQFT